MSAIIPKNLIVEHWMLIAAVGIVVPVCTVITESGHSTTIRLCFSPAKMIMNAPHPEEDSGLLGHARTRYGVLIVCAR